MKEVGHVFLISDLQIGKLSLEGFAVLPKIKYSQIPSLGPVLYFNTKNLLSHQYN